MTLTFPIRSDKLTMSVAVENHLAHVKTPFQEIDIYETVAFGRMLFLDGHVQLAERDEFAYHECLVHVPLLNVPNAETALIVGGGDGATARELLRHPNLKRVDFVEIDRDVIETCREHLPFLSAGVFEDPRLNLVIGDAFEFVKTAAEPYDLIVMDSTDVYEEEEGGLSERLWTDAFYADLRRLLKPNGVVVTQADNLVFCPYSMDDIRGTLGSVFPKVGSYWGLVPSFGGYSGFVWASKEGNVGPEIAPERLSALDVRYLNEHTLAMGFAPVPF
jgi:spermidine synthase